MSMVSYYNPAAMYRHHQQGAAQPSFHHSATAPMHPHTWYGGYHHQGTQPGTTGSVASTPSYCMQDEQQMWHPHSHTAMAFHNDFGTASHDFAAAAVAAAHGMSGSGMHHQHHHQLDLPENQLPSPPITVSGSELSSPGGVGGSVTPPNPTAKTRPAPARSPYDWINKPSYQSQPNPGKTRTKDKYRVVYSEYQRMELEKEFTLNNKYITIRRKSELANNLGLSERQIKIWFQNRRAKERKQVKKHLEEWKKNGNESDGQMQQYELKMMQMQNQYSAQSQMTHHNPHPHPNPNSQPLQHQAPSQHQLMRSSHKMAAMIESEFTSIKMETTDRKFEESSRSLPETQQASQPVV